MTRDGTDAARRPARDDRGDLWWLYELDATRTPGARAPRCLVLESATICRRLWRYPPDWRELPLHELLALPPR